MKVKSAKIPRVAAGVILGCTLALAQSRPPSAIMTPNGNVIIPIAAGVPGERDSAALAELTSHLAAVGSTSWVGMQATGKISYGSQDPTTYDATLSNLGVDCFRLDAQTKGGQASTRIHYRTGAMQNNGATPSTLSAEEAMNGIFPFEMFRSNHFRGNSTSLVDHGVVQVGSTSLHRITLERASAGRSASTGSSATIATDFYFDPSSHLLVKSVSSRPVKGSRVTNFLFVVTYSDYRNVGNTLVPFLYSETMEGAPYLTLQLTDVQLNPALDLKYFEF